MKSWSPRLSFLFTICLATRRLTGYCDEELFSIVLPEIFMSYLWQMLASIGCHWAGLRKFLQPERRINQIDILLSKKLVRRIHRGKRSPRFLLSTSSKPQFRSLPHTKQNSITKVLWILSMRTTREPHVNHPHAASCCKWMCIIPMDENPASSCMQHYISGLAQFNQPLTTASPFWLLFIPMSLSCIHVFPLTHNELIAMTFEQLIRQ